MEMHIVRLFVPVIYIAFMAGLQAQTGITSAGGDISGQGGTVAISVGQVVYEAHSGAGGSVSDGIQQAYPDMMVSIEYEKLLTGFSVYPNPVSSELVIDLDEHLTGNAQEDFYYVIRDLPGRIVLQGNLVSSENRIPVRHLQQGAYLVSIYFKRSRITSYKIIKAE